MKLDLTGDQELMRETARRFLEAESPLAAVRNAYESKSGFSADWWRRASELGWTMLGVPEELGGIVLSGHSAQDLAIVAEEMGRMVAPGPFQSTAVSLCALTDCKNTADHAALLPDIVAGSMIVSWAFGEPGNVWRSSDFKTTIKATADGWHLDGCKAYVEAGADAQYLVVTGLRDGNPMQLLVPIDSPGVSVIPCRSLDVVRRCAKIRFDGVLLPHSAQLQFDLPEESIKRQSRLAILLQCAETNGAVDRAMEFTMDYMRERYAFGRPIASYQALKHRLADMYLALHSCMAIVDAAIEAFDTASEDADMLTMVAKSYVGSRATEIMSDLVQLSGGIAVTWEHDLHLYSRRVALNRALYGTPEYHRFRIQQLLVA